MTKPSADPTTELFDYGTGSEVNAHWAQGILQAMPILLDAFDDDGCIVAWNAECERVTGYPAAEIVGNRCALEMLYPDIKYRTAMWEEALRRRHEDYGCVWELTAKDGARVAVEWFNVGARLVIPGWSEWSIGIDISERQRLEIALREATSREQRRIAGEIHDGLGQQLTSLAMLASALAGQRAEHDARLVRDLKRLASLANRSVTTCRLLAQGLSPVREHQYSLASALEQLVSDMTALATGRTVTFINATFAESVIPEPTNNHLYRIAQEALNNSMKHSGAHSIQIRLCVDPAKVCLQITDDGRGIGSLSNLSRGLGMQTMRDRAAAIGGAFDDFDQRTGWHFDPMRLPQSMMCRGSNDGQVVRDGHGSFIERVGV